MFGEALQEVVDQSNTLACVARAAEHTSYGVPDVPRQDLRLVGLVNLGPYPRFMDTVVDYAADGSVAE